jgi:hypothetical protein
MNTWDTTKQNVELAKDSSGAIDAMNETYKDSIEGAQKEMTAMMEKLYNNLLNPDFLKGFYEGLTKIVELVDSLTDAFGGLPGILLTVSSLLMKIY